MPWLQREIEDDRKSRFTNLLKRNTEVGTLGCGLTTSSAGWVAGQAAKAPLPTASPLTLLHDLNIPIVVVGREPIRPEGWHPHGALFAHDPRFFGRHTIGSSSGITRTERTTPSLRRRERELEWRRTHDAVLRSLENQWVVLEGDEIIASGRDPVQVINQAKSSGIMSPYIFFVEPKNENVVTIGL